MSASKCCFRAPRVVFLLLPIVLLAFIALPAAYTWGLFWDPRAASAAYIPGRWDAGGGFTVTFGAGADAHLQGNGDPPTYLAVLKHSPGRWKAWGDWLTLSSGDGTRDPRESKFKYLISNGGGLLVLYLPTNPEFDDPGHPNPDFQLHKLAQ